jgi:hypothetical protein
MALCHPRSLTPCSGEAGISPCLELALWVLRHLPPHSPHKGSCSHLGGIKERTLESSGGVASDTVIKGELSG